MGMATTPALAVRVTDDWLGSHASASRGKGGKHPRNLAHNPATECTPALATEMSAKDERSMSRLIIAVTRNSGPDFNGWHMLE